MAKVLIIDDDQMMCEVLAGMIRKEGHEPEWALTLARGITLASQSNYDIIFLDVVLPDGNGLDALPTLRSTKSSPEVIIITGSGDAHGAALAIKNGAWDYIQKPSTIEGMTLPFIRALEYREAKQARKPIAALKRQGIIGNSPAILMCLDQVAQVANSDINVLITGETGTGKELFAWKAPFSVMKKGLLPERINPLTV